MKTEESDHAINQGKNWEEITCNKAAELLANSHNVSGVERKTKKRLPEGSPLNFTKQTLNQLNYLQQEPKEQREKD